MTELKNIKIIRHIDPMMPQVSAARRMICLSNGNIAVLLHRGVAIIDPKTSNEIAFFDGRNFLHFAITEVQGNRIAMGDMEAW